MRIMAALFGASILVLLLATWLVDPGPMNPWADQFLRILAICDLLPVSAPGARIRLV